jgi:RecJ-like exonuclease
VLSATRATIMCSICEGYQSSLCPDCSGTWDDRTPEICSVCEGEGCIRFNEDGDDLTEAEYNLLPEDERFCDQCTRCEGTGLIYRP